MKINERVEGLVQWGHAISALIEEMESAAEGDSSPLKYIEIQAHRANPWFMPANVHRALKAISVWLDRKQLDQWVEKYQGLQQDLVSERSIGIIMAGNIPLVGFHDLLCVLISGNKAIIKCSSDDNVLLPFLLEVLERVSPEFAGYFQLSERFGDMDAVIATGSNNTSRYFDYYFGRKPHIIRKNRNSVAVLTGDESDAELALLGDDIFSYFGLGCRNVSKLYVPADYSFDRFFGNMEVYGELINHNKYMNNYDYHRALYLLNSEPFLTNNFLSVREHTALQTPVSVLHFERYADKGDVMKKLQDEQDKIQCIVGKEFLPFGSSQQPGLTDYADGVDTLQFLLDLQK